MYNYLKGTYVWEIEDWETKEYGINVCKFALKVIYFLKFLNLNQVPKYLENLCNALMPQKVMHN